MWDPLAPEEEQYLKLESKLELSASFLVKTFEKER